MAKRKRLRRRGFKIFLIIIVLIAALFYDSNTRIAISDYEVEYADLPQAFNGYRIVQLSDIHATSFGDGNEKLTEKVKEAEPNIIAITGDLIDSDDQSEYVRALMPKLAAIAPVYYVTGNHEWASGGIQELFDILEECGVTVLRNDYTVITLANESIVLAGAEDPNGPYDMEKPDELMARIRENEGDKFTVMLYHRNDKLAEFSALGVDLLLCGHAHGGIVRLPFTDGLIGPSRELFPTYTSGVYPDNDMNMIVSRGFGNAYGIPRFLNNPEVVAVTLKAAD